ncbi:MAG: aminotransferase class I/II-fold pyridoxal phosphate-dependent enzyme [Eubacteriales bacterium]|nr:aminotransferase class I/II-fold pyridoxal phosphate-dependent enzyme [Pseudomonadota bacterium]MBU4532563.1 aminotransferase class I/II-fold pyridoxal phosphate-dependent enzyme [Bacillota bacterium]MBV1728508.1 aminotransferase class I/II-fold pyridoxal phosphate-dependent enzyme [Desulforudis sp.]MDP3051182.1 aminotransferase class I/II-fold pyridoxal phosphate-dependent enzyme [Eubacteriales bacterium]MBU4553806.1 aminotransferase class I/II-fold pyridoxal phosphate-dependent enzyme [Bac
MNTDHGGHRTEGLLDFSVSINPLGPPACVAEILAQSLPLLTRYPSLDAEPARRAVADWLQQDAAEVLVGNGATELISLLVKVLRPNRVWVVEPCYSEYRATAESCGIPVVRLPYKVLDGRFEPEWETLRPGVGDLVFLGYPNNPTGQFPDIRRLNQLLDTDGVYTVLDESFLAFCAPSEPSSPAFPLRRGVIAVRSLTKFYAIPGLRLGYLLAERETVAALVRAKDPWSVNGLAEHLTGLLLADRSFADRTRKYVRAERVRVASALHMTGVLVYPGEANFLLGLLPDGKTVAALNAFLKQRGMIVRDASTFAGLSERHFRIGLRTAAENERLVAAITGFVRGVE